MNEDEHGITPPGETAMTLEVDGAGWLVTIEQGNGDVIKTLHLTCQERAMLGMMLSGDLVRHVQFVDLTRRAVDWPGGVEQFGSSLGS